MIKMVVTDLDGTLLSNQGCTCTDNIDTLTELADRSIVRVIATGRSPFSISKVIGDDYPIDFIIFSSGAGIIRWSDKQIVHSRQMDRFDVQFVIDELIAHHVDFMIHEPIPHNHCFLYYSTNNENPDFYRRIEVYQKFCQPYIPGIEFPNGATQIIAVLPNDTDLFNSLKHKFPNLKIIRTTSPLDGNSIWMEVFPVDVSKAYGISWLCKHVVGCNENDVMVIGNDYNDIDMLELTPNSFVVENAPPDLKARYKTTLSNDMAGFSVAVKKLINSQ